MYSATPLTNVSNWKILGMLIMAPIMGAAYVAFLPCAGFVLVGKYGLEKLACMARKLRHKRTVTA